MGHSVSRAVLLLVLVSTVAVATLAHPAPAQANWDGFSNYTYGGPSCSSSDYKDPLNYFFNTDNHSLGYEYVAKRYIAGWPVWWGSVPLGWDQ